MCIVVCFVIPVAVCTGAHQVSNTELVLQSGFQAQLGRGIADFNGRCQLYTRVDGLAQVHTCQLINRTEERSTGGRKIDVSACKGDNHADAGSQIKVPIRKSSEKKFRSKHMETISRRFVDTCQVPVLFKRRADIHVIESQLGTDSTVSPSTEDADGRYKGAFFIQGVLRTDTAAFGDTA